MRISIKVLKELAKKFDLSHVIIYAFSKDGKTHHVATYGDTVEACSQAATAGNKLKKALGWTEHLNTQPSRVKKLQKKVEEKDGLIEACSKIIISRIKDCGCGIGTHPENNQSEDGCEKCHYQKLFVSESLKIKIS